MILIPIKQGRSELIAIYEENGEGSIVLNQLYDLMLAIAKPFILFISLAKIIKLSYKLNMYNI